MDVWFNADAAERLLQQMDLYCSGIQKETKELLASLKSSSDWDDNQMKAFHANITELARDLNKALMLEGEYMRTYYQRVKELRG